MSGPLGSIVGAGIGCALAPGASMIVARPPLLDATESLGLPFRCDSCKTSLGGLSWLPIVGYLTSHGQCQKCSARVSLHQPLTEAFLVLLSALIGWRIGWTAVLPAYLVLGFVTVCVFAIDLRLHKIPTKLVYPAAGIAAVLFVLAAVVDGNTDALIRSAVGGIAAWAFLWMLVLFVPAGMGQGDARLCLLLGMCLGWLGWRHIYLGLLAGFLLGSVFGLGVVAVKRLRGSASIRSGLKTQIAFGPYLCAGALLLCLWPSLAS